MCSRSCGTTSPSRRDPGQPSPLDLRAQPMSLHHLVSRMLRRFQTEMDLQAPAPRTQKICEHICQECHACTSHGWVRADFIGSCCVMLTCCSICLLQLKKNINVRLCAMYLWTTFIAMLYKKFLLTACSSHAELIKLPDTSRDVHVADSVQHLSFCLQTWTFCLGKGCCSLQADAS